MSPFKRSQGLPPPSARRSIVAVVTAITVLLPMVAISALLRHETSHAAKSQPATARYSLRCWQGGKLILERSQLRLPEGMDPHNAKLQLIEGGGQPLFVAETRTATCLVRGGTVG